MTKIIKIENLSYVYKGCTEKALKNINLDIDKGERIALLGHSGSGKTTLMNCINRIIKPTSGKIFIEGKDIANANSKELREIRKKIAVIFQGFNLIGRETVLQNVLNGRLGHLSTLRTFFNQFKEEDYKITEESLKAVGLWHKKDERVNELSGGQKQRVAIARALSQNPKIILADEPVSNLDPKLIKTILFLLQKVCKEKGITLITSLHFVELIKEHFPRMIGLVDGEISFDDKFYRRGKSEKPNEEFSHDLKDEIIKKRLKQLGYID